MPDDYGSFAWWASTAILLFIPTMFVIAGILGILDIIVYACTGKHKIRNALEGRADDTK